ncbi:MAG: hypothetical protein DRR11_20390 [Gammaproteobacteria bacterium]|nr:MAG: hypothetical protein DRR11_20390 [Gammaproteobacteria bacterium]
MKKSFVDLLAETCKDLTDFHASKYTMDEKMVWLEANFDKVIQLYQHAVIVRHTGGEEDKIFNILLLQALGPSFLSHPALDFVRTHIKMEIQ